MVKNIQIEKTLGVLTKVTIDTTSQSKSFIKILQATPFSKTTKRQDKNPLSTSFGPTPTKIMDLLRIETRYSIDGKISQGAYSGDTHGDVEDRKDDLENLFLAGGIVTFNYDNETGVTGNIEKLQITKIFNDGQDNGVTGLHYEDNEAGYTVKLTIIKGVDFGN